MTTQTQTLASFLLARIAEDEADARALAKEMGRWERETDWNGADGSQGSITVTAIPGTASDPARVLARCGADRRIVEASQQFLRPDSDAMHAEALAHVALTALALPYADHPDYREEWRP